MRILLVNTNRNPFPVSPPVGLAYLIPPLQENGHTVKVLDLMYSKDPKQDIRSAVNHFKPKVAGFSIRNLDNQNMLKPDNPIPEIRELISEVRSKNIIVVLGGTAFTTLPQEMFTYLKADYGIVGEGIKTFPLLIEGIEKGKIDTRIPGLVWREKDDTVKVNTPLINGYGADVKPDWTAISLNKYRRHYLTPAIPIITKIGCPYQCSFCDTPIILGNKFILNDPKVITDQLSDMVKRYGAKAFFLVDPCFNLPLDWAKEVLGEIIKARLKIRFAAVVNPIHNNYDGEFMELYQRAGGFFAMVGYDSFSQSMLENYRKPFNIEDILNFDQLAAKYKFTYGTELLFGGPGETAETIQESMAVLPKINFSLFIYGVGVRILPHTEMFDIAKREGLVKDNSDLLLPKFYIAPDLDVKWAVEYINRHVNEYSYRFMRMIPLMLKNKLGQWFHLKY